MKPILAGTLAAAPLLAIALAGCDYPDPAFQGFQRKFGWTEERLLAAGWVPPRNLPAAPAWCYRTLARPDCYDHPLPPSEESRLIGEFEPDVD